MAGPAAAQAGGSNSGSQSSQSGSQSSQSGSQSSQSGSRSQPMQANQPPADPAGTQGTLALLAAAAGLLTGFVLWERRAESPMLDFGLFRERSFTAASVSAALSFISLNGLLFLLPFYLISGRWLSARIGTAIPATSGMVLLALGTLLLSRLGPYTELRHITAASALCGAGIGVFLSPNNSALTGSAPRSQQGIAAAIRATARN